MGRYEREKRSGRIWLVVFVVGFLCCGGAVLLGRLALSLVQGG